MLIVVWTSGTSTMLPLILSCPTLGACMSFSNGSQGASSLHSNSFRLKKNAGFGGNCMPLTTAQGGTLFLDKLLIAWCTHPFNIVNTCSVK